MRCRSVLLLFAAVGWAAAFGQRAAGDDVATREQLTQFDNRVLQAEKNRDIPSLDRFFAPTYTLTLLDGQRYDKAIWLGILKGPDHPVIESIHAANIHGYLFGDTTVIVDTTTLKSHDSKGRDTSATFHAVRLLLRQQGIWRVAGVELVKGPLG